MNTAPHPSHPDVADALNAIQALIGLAMRRVVSTHGQAAADALASDIKKNTRSLLFTIDLKQGHTQVCDARICGAAVKDGELEPLLNFEIEEVDFVAVAPGGSREH